MRQSVTLTNPQAEWLRAEAKRLGLTVSELLRRIIDQHREQMARTDRGEHT